MSDPQSPLCIAGIDHVVLRVTNMDRAREFYCGVLGCVEERTVPELGLVQLRAGDALIDLVDIALPLGRAGGAAPGTSDRNMDHFAIRIEVFDEAALCAHLIANGVEPGPVQTRYGAAGPGPSMYIRDPDGNVVELKGPAAA